MSGTDARRERLAAVGVDVDRVPTLFAELDRIADRHAWQLDQLGAAQRAALVAHGVDLAAIGEEQLTRLTVLGSIRADWSGWQTARFIAIGGAAELVASGVFTVAEICAAWECRESTYYRRVAELREFIRTASTTAATAAGDQLGRAAEIIDVPTETEGDAR